jgi:hypothetical protein
MSAHAEWAITRRIRLSATLSCDLTVGPGGAVCEWIGGHPRQLSPAQQRKYRTERNKLLRDVAGHLGGNVLLVE